ncbi:cellulase family glycosylhydrolase [Paenibacillus yanchengensis]|uniref:Cellulase family glycosylhydrolase n=1 Tax=Paenibacillus yanchengensis TaxID=2035833 RepID=A0ABW4YHV0_9BACL
MKAIRTDGSRFIDKDGRHVILHGISMVCKDKSKNFIDDWTETDFAKLKEWGFNVIRLGIIWDGIEPEPGKYDDNYLENIRKWMQLANKYDQYVFLDMHQDLYSQQYADGAPDWATMTDEHVYQATELWSDAYLFDRAVQTAFDHFWNNTAASDGIGLQDHYAAAWGHAVKTLSNEPNLIGYDIMNEPFIGSDVYNIVVSLFSRFAQLMTDATGQQVEVEQLFEVWLDPEKKMEALQMLDDPAAYGSVMNAAGEAQAYFEREVLSPFNNKVAAAIREVDQHGILFLETNYFSNMGVESSIAPVTNAAGIRDAEQCYAPHGYDLVTDSDFVHAANNDRIDFIFEQHEKTRQRLNMPMMIGEWGAYGESEIAEAAALHIQTVFEKLLVSDAYWCYLYPEMDRYSSFKGVQRSYPMAASGPIDSYSFVHATNTFQLAWQEDASVTAPTVIYFPNLAATQQTSLTIDNNNGAGNYEWVAFDDGVGGLLVIQPIGGGARKVQIG